ncbi:MAG TPA: ergothioneine biosynthesis protein EgtB [Actinomycetota bacterium]|nr:ergothioneine biosynthesis protein EgtB [Actinomycetota bacterium]
MDVKERAALGLETVRRRSLSLVDPVPEEDLVAQHSPLMSPLVWDLAHVGNYEEIWLLRTIAGLPARNPQLDDIYDAFKHARKERTRLKLLDPSQSRVYISDVRGQVLDTLDRLELDPANPLLAEGYVYGMVIQHEHQHDETMLATLQLRKGEYPVAEPVPVAPPPVGPREVLVPAGSFVLGTSTEPWAYDNERPAHEVHLDGFWIDVFPVTNAEYLQFMEDGGYQQPRWWTERGWAWRLEQNAEHPQFWHRDAGSWSRTRFGRNEKLPLDEPVQHVCWYEADAYARWAGKRLPAEAEWEKAASWDPAAGRKLRYPWGDADPTAELANLEQRYFRPSPAGSYQAGASPYGCLQLIGDVWEWTSSDFLPYPGSVAFPYREYSEVFYGGDYKVLRGGSWATHPAAVRNTFRNWDYPIRRQIFSGFRCARDA